MKRIINNKSPFVIKGDIMVQARLELDDYTIRILDVIKGVHKLKNRSEALNHFVRDFGQKIIEPKVSEKILKELDRDYKEHIKKHGYKSMNEKELNKILNLN